MNFPNSPGTGDTYTVGTRSWKWNGAAWDRVVIAGQVATGWALVDNYVQDTVDPFPLISNSFTLLNYV